MLLHTIKEVLILDSTSPPPFFFSHEEKKKLQEIDNLPEQIKCSELSPIRLSLHERNKLQKSLVINNCGKNPVRGCV